MSSTRPSIYGRIAQLLTIFALLPACSTIQHISNEHRSAKTWSRQVLKPASMPRTQPKTVYASNPLPTEIGSLLDRSGVKLVAVEFYATWCKPCMAAVPRWKALHDRYRSQGLRLIVINTQDPNGACSAPGWAPDELICDLQGHIAEAMKVSNLPSAFLYSWQGNTLVERAHIEEVEREIEAYMIRNPRVRVDAKGQAALETIIRNELARKGKVTVVATKEEQALAAETRKLGYQSNYQSQGRCKLGQEISANSVLRVTVVESLLNLQLFSAESSCLLQGVSVQHREGDKEGTVAEAVDKLLDALKQP